jgi:rhodanese-related sulfurtransferase
VKRRIMIWTLAIIALVVLGWYGYEGSWDRRLFKAGPGQVCANIHPREAKAFLDAHPDTQVLDVRSAAEFSGGAIPGAIHLSVGDPEFVEKARQLDQSSPVLVYCAGGYRSRKAVARLKTLGFIHLQNLHRGYHSWRLAGLPVAAPRSGPGRSSGVETMPPAGGKSIPP